MEPVSGVLFGLFRGTPQDETWIVACFEGAWQRLMGETLARVCRPVAFRGAQLTVEVLDPAWVEAVRSMEPELLDRLRTASANEVRSLRILTR